MHVLRNFIYINDFPERLPAGDGPTETSTSHSAEPVRRAGRGVDDDRCHLHPDGPTLAGALKADES